MKIIILVRVMTSPANATITQNMQQNNRKCPLIKSALAFSSGIATSYNSFPGWRTGILPAFLICTPDVRTTSTYCWLLSLDKANHILLAEISHDEVTCNDNNVTNTNNVQFINCSIHTRNTFYVEKPDLFQATLKPPAN